MMISNFGFDFSFLANFLQVYNFCWSECVVLLPSDPSDDFGRFKNFETFWPPRHFGKISYFGKFYPVYSVRLNTWQIFSKYILLV